MNVPQRAIGLFFSLTILISGIGFSIPQLQDISKGLDQIKNPYKPIVEVTEIPKAPLYSGSQVIGQLIDIGTNKAPIQVDDVTFLNDSDVKNNQNIVDLPSSYLQQIERNPDGTIKKIIFTKEV